MTALKTISNVRRAIGNLLALGECEVDNSAERDLRECEARERVTIEASLNCIVSVDRLGKIIEFNPAAERTFGYTRLEILGRDLAGLLIPAIHWEDLLTGMSRNSVTNRCQVLRQKSGGIPAIRKDGSEFIAELTVVRMEKRGEPFLTAFLRDITELEVAAERQADAAAQMKKAKDEAEAANRSKSQFLANMSHEVRTPMAAILGYADIILDPKLDPARQVEYVRAIRRNGEHLLRLINDILDLSKIEAGQLVIERVRCRLWQMVTDAISITEVRTQEKRLRLSAIPIGKLPRRITTDPTRFNQILFNLLDNAVKFTEPGKSIELRVHLDKRPNGPVLVIEVQDQGRGMTAEEIARLFRPFVQADPSMTRRYGGTGLGLSICKRLAERFRGEISVCSTLGVGSCFTVILPVAPSDLGNLVGAEELVNESQFVKPSYALRSRRLTCRVLLAEDNADNRQILRYFLEHGGLEVETVENGREAFEMALSRDFDLVLMDMQMPDLDGYAATSLLRDSGFAKPIIALTAHAMAGDEEKCLQAGCTSYLTKPVQPENLIALVAKHLPKATCADSCLNIELPPIREQVAVQEDRSIDRLFADFRAALPNRIRNLQAALDEADWKSLTSLAHQLKGAAGMYEMPAVSEAAAQLEGACREDQKHDRVAEVLAELAECVAKEVAISGAKC